jgi:hypothetical protein
MVSLFLRSSALEDFEQSDRSLRFRRIEQRQHNSLCARPLDRLAI